MSSIKTNTPEYKPTHVRTAIDHVWQEVATGRFVFEDETNCFSGDFTTIELAHQAMRDYWIFSLDHGIETVQELIANTPGITTLESVQQALERLANHEGPAAIAALREDGENILKYSPPLYVLVLNKPT